MNTLRPKNVTLLIGAVTVALASTAFAQASTRISLPSKPMTVIDFDRLPLSPTPLNADNDFVITELAIQNGGFPFPLARPVASAGEPLSTVDFDTFPVGANPNLQQINASGSNGGASLRRVQLTPVAGTGIYNTDTNRGRALAVFNRNGSQATTIVDNSGSVVFRDFQARLDFATPTRVFGLGVGDVANTVVLDF